MHLQELFTTALGSRYFVDRKGRSIRWKPAQANWYSQGWQRPCLSTRFFDQKGDSVYAAWCKRSEPQAVQTVDDQLFLLSWDHARSGYKVDNPDHSIRLYHVPGIGMTPFEILGSPYLLDHHGTLGHWTSHTHFGHQIISIGRTPGPRPKMTPRRKRELALD